MSWQAFSSADIRWYPTRKGNPVHMKEFKKAGRFINNIVGTYIAGGLTDGVLSLSGCRDALHKATGQSVWDEWTAEQVREYCAKANWNFKPPRDGKSDEDSDIIYYWNAFIFLETCARLGLSIRFSW